MIDLDTVVTLSKDYGLWLLAPMAVLEGPIVTVIAAYLASLTLLPLTGVIIVVILGDLVGDAIYYAAGRNGAGWLSPRWRHRLGVSDARLIAMTEHFRTQGGRTLLIGKLTHSAGAAVLIAAGAARMHFATFLWYNLLGTVPKSLFFVAIGYTLGRAYSQIDNWIYLASMVMLALIVLTALGFWWYRRRR